MKRPGIHEHDVGSYLDGRAMPHKVERIDRLVLVADPASSFDFSECNEAGDLCRDHAFELLRSVGFSGPIEVDISYSGFVDTETAMVKLDPVGGIEYVAEYSYGRADFSPGQPRTKPCSVCGVETLIDDEGWLSR